MSVEDLGEFGLIARLTAGLRAKSPGVVAGIGDDAAALRTTPGQIFLATSDSQVEGSHFILASARPFLLGRKSLAVNLSDIAAMGGTPRFALVSLGIKPGMPIEFFDDLYRGLAAQASESGVSIVGGNVARSESLFVDITVFGEVEPDRLILRRGARLGDSILVTGCPGRSAAGLALALGREACLSQAVVERLLQAWDDPRPRVSEGRVISASCHCTAMIDVSDGLAADLGHLCDASRVGAVVWAERVPISADLEAYADSVGADALEMALHGGEDYELLFTVGEAAADDVANAVERATGTHVAAIGRIQPLEAGLSLITSEGETRQLVARGYEHL